MHCNENERTEVMWPVKSLWRIALLLFCLTSPLAAAPHLRDVAQVRGLLSAAGLWTRVVEVVQKTAGEVYPKVFHAVVFEFNSALWFYTPHDGTQSLSQYQGQTEKDKRELSTLVREVVPEMGAIHEEPVTEAAARNPRHPENGCFVESIAALVAEQKRTPGLTEPQLFSYYCQTAQGVQGHTVLCYRQGTQGYVIDRTLSETPRQVPLSMLHDGRRLARWLDPERPIVRTRFLAIRPPSRTIVADAPAKEG